MIVVISGPGGVGKGTVVSELVTRDPKLWLSRSWTTRAPRPGEAVDAYVFATADQFDAHVEAGGFLEHVEFLDYRQGSPLPTPPDGCDALFEIDVYGAQQIASRFENPLLIFIDAPSRDKQRERLVGRGDHPERVDQRLEKATEEAALAKELGMLRVINDDLDECVAEIIAMINGRRARTD